MSRTMNDIAQQGKELDAWIAAAREAVATTIRYLDQASGARQARHGAYFTLVSDEQDGPVLAQVMIGTMRREVADHHRERSLEAARDLANDQDSLRYRNKHGEARPKADCAGIRVPGNLVVACSGLDADGLLDEAALLLIAIKLEAYTTTEAAQIAGTAPAEKYTELVLSLEKEGAWQGGQWTVP